MIYLMFTWLLWPILILSRHSARRIPERILVIQRAKIGDVICSTPVFNNLRTTYPSATIDILASPVAIDLLRANPRIDNIDVWTDVDLAGLFGKWRLVRRLRSRNYDLVVCLNAGLVYPLACFWAGIPLRYAVRPNFIGTTYRLACSLWTEIEPHDGDRLIGETYAALLGRLGVKTALLDKEVFSAPNAAAKALAFLSGSQFPRIGIGVGAGNKLKALTPQMLGDVLAGLFAKYPDCSVVLIGTDADRKIASELVARFPVHQITDACGAFRLAELPALLGSLNAYLGVDSGITYMADALGVPLVSVAGPCNMRETRPVGQRAIVIQEFPPCAPCAHIFRTPYSCASGDLSCLRAIDANRVVQALCGLLVVDESNPQIDAMNHHEN